MVETPIVNLLDGEPVGPSGAFDVPTLAVIRDRLDTLIAATAGPTENTVPAGFNPVLMGAVAQDTEPTALTTLTAARLRTLLKKDLVVAQISSGLAVGQISPSTTAGGTVIAAARLTRRRLVMANHHANVDVFVGPSGVTTANGFKIAAGGTLTLYTAAEVRGIVASGTGTVHYVEEY